MSKSRPVVVVHPEQDLSEPAPDTERRTFYDRDGRWIGWAGLIKNDAGDASGWHHHAANDTYVYVIRGSVTIEFGPDGGQRVEAHAGDFFLVPPQTIHREMTGPDADLDAFVVRVGGEPERVAVDGPGASIR